MTHTVGRRVALVVGNGAYKYAPPLTNPPSDAESMAAAFHRLGITDVKRHRDLDQRAFSRALADFAETADGADAAIFYFAGHGIDIDGENYLLPTDAELSHLRRVKFETQALGDVLSAVAGAKSLGLVILDACRDNPFRTRLKGIEHTRSAAQGLGLVEPKGDTLVAYAAKHGTVARDGTGQGHSPFTRALLDFIERPELELRLLFGKVRDAVLEATGGAQEPHLYGSLGGKEIFLRPRVGRTTASDVFISYARQDRERASQLAGLFQREGWNVFWDQELIVGDDWRDVIEKRLRAARCVVAVWSQHAIGSDWVKYEAAKGREKGVLIPVTIDGTAPPKVFDAVQTEDLSGWDGSYRGIQIERVLRGIRTIIDRAEAVAGPEPKVTSTATSLAAEPWPPTATPPRPAKSGSDMSAGARFTTAGLGVMAVAAVALAAVVLLQAPKTIEKPVYLEKPVYVEKPVIVEKPVVVEKQVTTPVTPRSQTPPPFAEEPRYESVSPSFNCEEDTAPDEQTVCHNARLARLDLDLAQSYTQLSGRLSGQDGTRLRNSQRGWLKQRSACQRDEQCIEALYIGRIQQLKTWGR